MITARTSREELYDLILARNTQYDGVFFFAVTSTGIYCRPSCPARRPLKKNCNFFTTAREAEKCGFRACKRCRPDQAKTSEAILHFYKTRPNGFMDTKNAILTMNLDVGERQFRRLVKNNIGKTPTQISRQQRLEYAYQLLLHTDLSIINIAFRAEFSSIRQFNYAFKQRYGINPSHTRKSKRD